MSFIDELKAVVKSPEEIENQRKQENITFGNRCALQDYTALKKAMIKAAEKNEYVIIGDKKIIECTCNCSFWDNYYKNISPERAIIGFAPIRTEKIGNIFFERGIRYFVRNQEAFEAYNSTIRGKAEKDGISVRIATMYSGTLHPFPTEVERINDMVEPKGLAAYSIEIVLVGKAEL